jgi:hypothetical protein
MVENVIRLQMAVILEMNQYDGDAVVVVHSIISRIEKMAL